MKQRPKSIMHAMTHCAPRDRRQSHDVATVRSITRLTQKARRMLRAQVRARARACVCGVCVWRVRVRARARVCVCVWCWWGEGDGEE